MTTNLETIQAIYAAFGRGDVPSILDKLADDVAWEGWADPTHRAKVPWLAPRHGKAGATAFFHAVAASLEIREFQVLGFLAGGDQVAVEVVIDAIIPATGRNFRDEELHLWTFNAAGEVTRMRHYVDTAKHVLAATGTLTA